MEILSDSVYNHFLALNYAARILVCEELQGLLDYADELLRYFASTFGQLYGVESLSYNVHNLLHLCGDVKVFGPPDGISSFRYESKLNDIKRTIKKSERPLQQMVRRIHEQMYASTLVVMSGEKPLDVQLKIAKRVERLPDGFSSPQLLELSNERLQDNV